MRPSPMNVVQIKNPHKKKKDMFATLNPKEPLPQERDDDLDWDMLIQSYCLNDEGEEKE